MQTPLQVLIQILEKEAEFLSGEDDHHDDKMVATGIRLSIDQAQSLLAKEKEDIRSAFHAGRESEIDKTYLTSEQYFSETFKP